MSWETAKDVLIPETFNLERIESCPHDGTPLDEVKGVLHCPFCGRVFS